MEKAWILAVFTVISLDGPSWSLAPCATQQGYQRPWVVSSDGCDLYRFQECITDFSSKHPQAQNSLAPSYSEAMLNEVCSDLGTLQSCAGSAVSGCQQEVRMMWDVLDDSLDYICSDDSKQIFKEFNSCMNDHVLESDINSCNRTMMSAMTSMQYSGASKSEVCSLMKTFGQCVVTAGTTHCNSARVGRWYGGLVDASLGPTKDLFDCRFKSGTTPPPPTTTTTTTATHHAGLNGIAEYAKLLQTEDNGAASLTSNLFFMLTMFLAMVFHMA